jgi:hypothetical protein
MRADLLTHAVRTVLSEGADADADALAYLYVLIALFIC